jgi:hypothetical protein
MQGTSLPQDVQDGRVRLCAGELAGVPGALRRLYCLVVLWRQGNDARTRPNQIRSLNLVREFLGGRGNSKLVTLVRLRRIRVSGLRKAFERGFDEVGQRVQVVATLEHGGDARRELCRAAGELAEPVRGQLHVRERIVDVRVEAG